MDVTRLLVLLVVAGAAVTLLAAPSVWYMDEGRRVRRGLRIILRGDTHGLLVARGRGRGIGFNFTHDEVAVAWDMGAWGLLYPLSDLVGVEAIADDQVVGRVHRGEPRRALDSLGGAEDRVSLRLVFRTLGEPDFQLDLWLPEDDARRDRLSATEALEEANRWLARIDALFSKPPPPMPITLERALTAGEPIT